MTASSNGWPGQTKAANGCPGGATSGFSRPAFFLVKTASPSFRVFQ